MNAISRPRRYGVWILVALAAAGGVYYWSKQAKKADVITLDKTTVKRGNLIESISSTGALSALEEVTVGSQVSGIVTKVLVDFNDYVKKGDLLALVDPQTLQAQVDSSRAALIQRETAYKEAVQQLDESKPIYAQGYLSDKDIRTLQVAVNTAKAQLDAAKVDFEKQNVQLKYAEIRAPIDGIISNRNVDPGNTVQSSMTAPTMFVVASDLRTMKILATVDETQIPLIKEGMKARFTVSGLPDNVFNATVRQVRLKSTTTNNVVTYTVVLDAENPDLLLFPGMTTTISFIQSSHENVLLIPNTALRVNIPVDMRVASSSSESSSAKDDLSTGQGTQHADGKAASAEVVSVSSVSSSSAAGMASQRDGTQNSDRGGMMARAETSIAAVDANSSAEGMSGRRDRGQNGDHTGGGMHAGADGSGSSAESGGGMSGQRDRGQNGDHAGPSVASADGGSASGAASGGMSGRDRVQGSELGGSPAGAGGGGMSGPREMGQNGGQGKSGRSRRTAVWMVNAEGKAYSVPVRVIASDLTSSAVEPLQPDALKEGDEIVTRVVNPNSSSSTSSSKSNSALQGFGATSGFGAGGGGNTGMGGGGR